MYQPVLKITWSEVISKITWSKLISKTKPECLMTGKSLAVAGAHSGS
jgi:hypothetical protein